MAKTIELKLDFISFKKGEVLEVIDENKGVYTIKDSKGDAHMIPVSFCKVPETGSSATTGTEEDLSEKEEASLTDLFGKEFVDVSKREESDRLAKLSPEERAKEEEERKKAIEEGKKAIIKAREEAIKSGHIKISTITGGNLPKSKIDHGIDVFSPTAFKKELREYIPKVKDDFIWDANVLERLILAHKLNKKCLMVGMPGTGKSTAAEQLCAWIRQPCFSINGKDGVEPSSLIGSAWTKEGGGELVWKDGILPYALKNGAMLVINEVFKLHAGIQMVMQTVYEDESYLILDEKRTGSPKDMRVNAVDTFRLLLTDNVRGTGDNFDKFAGTHLQDTSSIDRCTITIDVDYLPEKREVLMLHEKYPTLDGKIIQKLVRFAGLIRKGYKKGEYALTLSPRGLQTICDLLTMEDCPDFPLDTAIDMAYIAKLSDETEVQAVKHTMDTVGI